jgi:pyruvate kinase
MKKTKIVATLGPATESEEALTAIFKAGVDVVRMNFSHGSHEEHGERLARVRAAAKQVNKTIGILQDLSGPKIRIGDFTAGEVTLVPGATFILTTEQVAGDEKRVHVNYEALLHEVYEGAYLLLDDGKKKLQVERTEGNDIITKVIVGGPIKSRRGINAPGVELSVSSLTEKDRQDLEFGLTEEVDFMALSFVRRPEDVIELKQILAERGSAIKVIAKIETQGAVDNLTEIVAAADGVMVARGDLAIEVPLEKVPLIQKRLIAECNRLGKPVITATQMLESMIESPVPTRAEVSDVANAVIDGTDAVMLSGESAVGKYPVEAVEIMARVAAEIEGNYPDERVRSFHRRGADEIVDSVTASVVNTAKDIDAHLIVALTTSGLTARMVSRFRPRQPILAISPDALTCRQLTLSYGCIPVLSPAFDNLVDAWDFVTRTTTEQKLAAAGDALVLAAGMPLNHDGVKTNMLVVHYIA